MNRTPLAALVVAFSLALPAVAADRREERPVSGFHAIAMGVDMDLEVIQDGTESLVLEGDAEVLAKIDTFVKDGTLDIMYKRGSRTHAAKRVHAVVHARDMDALALSATGRIRAPALKSDAFALSISGSGDVEIGRLVAARAQLGISGSGNVSVAGRADDLTARISGSGDIEAPRLETQRAQVNIAGSGRATVWARQQLATAISGAGTVRYYGDPSLAKSVRGAGHVERVAANP
jgi:hypothetical protein